ncbi:hypothetical protein OHB04_24810 [Streptomyces sp. NBC_01775]|uniref:hypothetical protein n=1 Tax=Streptomyces sp. NBC_01775 TaxID=2975939 RepID=UPI002DD8ABA0|nr:hypothetical protein [Streptomyces sp. NBC_01775]WSB78663.1 hypothetical protein OHB04_24810 [Streptomyces sp. NBC_01775]
MRPVAVPVTATPTPQLGSLYIRSLPTVPANTASVGLGMSNSPFCAVQARPGTTLEFTPHRPAYFLTAGNFAQGEVLDAAIRLWLHS